MINQVLTGRKNILINSSADLKGVRRLADGIYHRDIYRSRSLLKSKVLVTIPLAAQKKRELANDGK